MAFVIGGYYIHYKPIMVAKGLVQIYIHTTSTLPELKDNYQRLLDYQTFGTRDVRTLMVNTANQVLASGEYHYKDGLAFLQFAVNETLKEIKENPGNLEVLIKDIVLFTGIAIIKPELAEEVQVYIDMAQEINPGHLALKRASSTIKMLRKMNKKAGRDRGTSAP